ncbi:type VI secretion system tip protein TssI/VgrG [Aggregatibacter actinomycetemcomitans]|uniref:type VI secretion system tip protein TssI/VgrG n=1 Tax=Aggregatibacter actinomycetemcomitans TaxID=714 RepID=UPI0025463164|nr:type VI secretion system tip protein TssI/VgrG [Aggregatibacter actinomycetemcomitans]
MTLRSDSKTLVASSGSTKSAVEKTAKSSSGISIPTLNDVASLAGKIKPVAAITGDKKLTKRAARVQERVAQVQQGVAIGKEVIQRVQQWGKKPPLVGIGGEVGGTPSVQDALSALLGRSPSGLQFTFHSAGVSSDSFEVLGFDLWDGYSEPFTLHLELSSKNDAIPFVAVLDNEAYLTFWQDGEQVRRLTGIVNQFEQGDSGFHNTFYRLQLRPTLWRLGLRSNSRIFQQKDLQTILATLLDENKVTDYRFMLCDSHPEREFCVQYRETDLAFFERLAAEEGLFYYFDEQSRLVISDDASTLNNEKAITLNYNPNKNAQLQENTLSRFAHSERVRVSQAVLKDYTFKKPLWEATFTEEAKDLEAQRAMYEHYDFPGRFKDGRGKQYSRYRLESLRRDAHSGRGESNSPLLMAGGLINLQSHPNAAFNTLWQLSQVHYHAEQAQGAQGEAGERGTHLTAAFECLPRHQTWRPLQRTKPLVEGPQPAIVTGPKGEEIYTDNFGRVRLQFLWDREGKYDDHSSCWVRVTQPWAGKGWGMVAIPRVGHEVMVDFLEGDPDQPIVTGRTYHVNMPLPAKLPQNKTQMHLMSQTYKGGGYNGMMMEDEQGKQRLDFQAQRDMNTLVLNDRATNVGGNHKETVKGEQKVSVGKARYKEVAGEETQTIDEAQIITVGKDYQLIANNGPVSMTSKADNVIFETAGARLTLFKNGNIQLEGKSVCINGKLIDLNPGGAATSSAEADSAPASDDGGDGGARGGGAGGGSGGGGGGASGGNDSSGAETENSDNNTDDSGFNGGVGAFAGAGANGSANTNESIPCKAATAVGRPVNPILGLKLLTNEVDFAFAGLMPLVWSRSYYSDQMGTGWLGQGWSVPGCQRIERQTRGLVYIDEQGRELLLPALTAGSQEIYHQAEQIWIQYNESGEIIIASLDKRLSLVFRSLSETYQAYVLSAIQDAFGNQQRFDYDTQTGLLQKVTDGNGREFYFAFENLTQDKTDTSPLWRLVSIEHQKDQQRIPLVHYRYNTEGDLVEVLDSQKTIVRTFGYHNHIMVSHRNASGLESYYKYDVYGPKGKVLRNTTNLDESWQFEYHPTYTQITDSLGRIEQYHFDNNQEIVKRVFADGSQAIMERDNLGRLLSQTDSAGKTTSYVYNEQGQVIKITRPDQLAQQYQYDNNGRLVAQTDVMGNQSHYVYDSIGNLTIATNALGESVKFEYSNKGLRTAMIDPLGNRTTFNYNADNQLASRVDCSGNITQLEYNDDGLLTTVIDALGQKTHYIYNNNHQLIQTTYADGSQEQFTYDTAGRLITYTDGKGNQTEYEYSVDDLPVSRKNALGHTFAYTYDNARRLVQLTNENLVTYRFDYDPMNRLTAEIGFDNRKTVYHYNEKGELATQQEFGTDNHKQVLHTTEFKRDKLGRVIAEQIQQFDGQTQQTSYHYDQLGRLSQLEDEQTTIHFTYDNVGRVIEHHLSDKNDHSQVMRYTYDANGNRLKTKLPNGEQIDYHYYGSGHLSTIKFNDRLISDITRDKLHREVSRTQGKLVKLDAIGRLEEQLATLEQQTTQQALVNRTYRYNEVGNLIQSRDLRMGNQDYYYDKLGQLTMTGNEVFAFDPAHNLIERESEKRLNNQLHEYQGITYYYDEFGNLSQRKRNNGEVQTYSYNAKDRLIKAVIQRPNQKAETWHYQYDVLGRRMIKVRSENGAFLAHTMTEFMWDGSHLVQEINRENDRTFSYIYRSPQSYEPLAQVCTDNKQNHTQTRYFHCDQIGVPRELTDENGNLCWYGDYLGWGKLRNSHNLMANVHQPFRLQNQYADEETGLHYNFFRYYDPYIGRFTQQDPIGLAGGNNLYRFEGAVQNQTDPLGLFAPVLAAPWILEGLAYAGTAMAGILIGVGIMDAKEEYDKAQAQSAAEIEASKCEKERKRRCKKWGTGTPAQARNIVNINRRGPKGIKRIDRPEESVPGSQYHAHAYNDAALNVDGTVHDKHRGMPPFSKDDKDFLFCYGWKGV